MMGWPLLPALVAASVVSFSSCTCHDETPEQPAKLAQRPMAFMTPRKPKVPEARSTPRGTSATPPSVPSAKATPDQTSLPENFPEGIPLPYGGKVMAVQNLANDARNVVFSSDGDTPDLFNLYKNTMSGSGWGKPTQEYQGKDQSFLSFKRGNTITNVSVSKDPKTGKRIVAVMYYDEKPLPFPEF